MAIWHGWLRSMYTWLRLVDAYVVCCEGWGARMGREGGERGGRMGGWRVMEGGRREGEIVPQRRKWLHGEWQRCCVFQMRCGVRWGRADGGEGGEAEGGRDIPSQRREMTAWWVATVLCVPKVGAVRAGPSGVKKDSKPLRYDDGSFKDHSKIKTSRYATLSLPPLCLLSPVFLSPPPPPLSELKPRKQQQKQQQTQRLNKNKKQIKQ